MLTNLTMAKRKRSSNSPSPAPADPAERAAKSQKRVCNRCLVDAKKSLVAALRLGAGFERQKHSRRKKTAQAKKDTKALERLDAEYAVLKALELEKIADQQLRKTVGRVKSLKDQEVLKSYVAGIEKSSADTATLNVLARLYKVAAVKKVVDDTVEQLKAIFAPSDAATPTINGDKKEPKKRKAEAQKDADTEMLDVSDEEGDPYAVFNARIAAPSSGEDGSEGSVSDDERPPSIGDSEREHDPEDDLEAESSSEEAEEFSGGESEASDDEDMAIDRRIAPPSDASDSDSDSIAQPTKKTRTKALPAQPTSSAFIPSLSHAAYIAGSDSDASDLSASFAPRKNRRGQRARQKIAEAKFGAKAKHIANPANNRGWDAKRGAVPDVPRGGYGPVISGENAIPLGGKEVVVKEKKAERDDKGDLHPSWQAAKLAKEKKAIKIDLSSKGGMGKKVVFD
jgi:hypothetical protein